jgi:hypothetical protein
MGHIGVLLSGVTFVNTLYLISRDWAVIRDFGYIEIIAVGAGVLLPFLVYIGYLDYKRGFYHVEASIATEENPYLINKFTRKERDLLLPLSMGVANYLANPCENNKKKLCEACETLNTALEGNSDA